MYSINCQNYFDFTENSDNRQVCYFSLHSTFQTKSDLFDSFASGN